MPFSEALDPDRLGEFETFTITRTFPKRDVYRFCREVITIALEGGGCGEDWQILETQTFSSEDPTVFYALIRDTDTGTNMELTDVKIHNVIYLATTARIEHLVGGETLNEIYSAVESLDAGYLDTYSASSLCQIALYGEVLYG